MLLELAQGLFKPVLVADLDFDHIKFTRPSHHDMVLELKSYTFTRKIRAKTTIFSQKRCVMLAQRMAYVKFIETRAGMSRGEVDEIIPLRATPRNGLKPFPTA